MNVQLIACEACGDSISLSARACPKCGHPVSVARRKQVIESQYTGGERAGHGLGSASLGCAIPGLIFFWTPFVGLPLSGLAFVFSLIALPLGKKKGAATAGLVISLFGLLGSVGVAYSSGITGL